MGRGVPQAMTPEKKKELIKTLCKNYGVDILYTFGSRSKEVAGFLFGEGANLISGPSDVDIGVKMVSGRKLDVKEKVFISISLEDLLGVGRVDLVVLSEADPFLAAEIIRGERLFAMDDTGADEFELYILRRAGDLIPLERERESLIFKEER
jgi:predicted nucleotidyltransferase